MTVQHILRGRSGSLFLRGGRHNAARLIVSAHHASFSSSASDGGDGSQLKTNNNQHNRVPKTLYRQLLSWCRQYDDVPFSPLPPVTLTPPQVNSYALKHLLDMRTFLNANEVDDTIAAGGSGDDVDDYTMKIKHHPAHYAMYNDGVVVKENMITFPEMTNSQQLRNTIRAVYWLNNENAIANIDGDTIVGKDTSAGDVKEQVSLAFETIKSCNQLSSTELDTRRDKRKLSINIRQGKTNESGEEYPSVDYHVGQVVAHKSKKWRGVIVGWTIDEKKDKNKDGDNGSGVGSLTKKQYSFSNAGETTAVGDNDAFPETSSSKVQYTILVDLNDAQSDTYDFDDSMLFGKSISVEQQADLSPVDDPCLQRIYNGLIKQYFTRFDARGHFVPNEMISYMYPLDHFSHCKYEIGATDEEEDDTVKSETNVELEKSRVAIVEGAQEIARRLLVPLSDFDGQEQGTEDDGVNLLSSLKSALESLLVDSNNKGSKNHDSAMQLLAKLYNIHVKVNALLWTRNKNKQDKNEVKFSLGQVVKHKIYGFRGFVSAWDRTPRIDVSNWDGLRDVKNPQDKPFYHINADVNDCIKAFGAPRSYRYVIEENLELSPLSSKPLELSPDLDYDEWKFDAETGRYTPSAEMKFMYAEKMGENEEAVINAIRTMRKILTDCLLEVRDGSNNEFFSMDDLFCQLQYGADNLEDATVLQDLIKEIWKENSDFDIRDQLDEGILQLMNGKYEKALETFSNCAAADPSYGEAWNKKATVYYMLNEKDNSRKAAERALEIEHRNFQALAGIGLIEMDSSQYDNAIKSFRKCLDIHPWLLTVSARLSKCFRRKGKGIEFP